MMRNTIQGRNTNDLIIGESGAHTHANMSPVGLRYQNNNYRTNQVPPARSISNNVMEDQRKKEKVNLAH